MTRWRTFFCHARTNFLGSCERVCVCERVASVHGIRSRGSLNERVPPPSRTGSFLCRCTQACMSLISSLHSAVSQSFASKHASMDPISDVQIAACSNEPFRTSGCTTFVIALRSSLGSCPKDTEGRTEISEEAVNQCTTAAAVESASWQ